MGDISYITELVRDLDRKPTDLFLNTSGGQTDATEAIVSLLQSTIADLRVIVPHSAKSNGTMICLAASEIVMGAPSELGPIDPSLNGTPTSILADQVVAQQNFALHKLALYAIEQTKKLAKSLLTKGMMSHLNEAEVDDTIRKLASRDEFFSHGSVIDHVEASNLKLNVKYLPLEDELWQKLWLLYSMYAHDSGATGVVKIFEGRSVSTAVLPPSGTP